MKNKLRLRPLLASVLAVILLLGCSGGTVNDNTSDTPTETTDDVVEISFAWWGDTMRHELYNSIVDLFEAENPDVRVMREPAPWGDYWTRLATQSAGGNSPTVFGMHPQFVSDYALRGVLMDLSGFVGDGTIETADIAQSVMEGAYINNELTGIPKAVGVQAFGVNRTLLEQFGLEAPARTEDWSWSEFEALATDFADATAGEDLFFSVDHSGDWVYFRWAARQSGGDIYTDDATELGFDEEVLTQWFDFWNRLRDIGATPDAATTVEQGQMAWQERRFPAGMTAFSAFPANQLTMQQTQIGNEYILDMVRVPQADGETRRAENLELPAMSISSTATEAEAKAAARLINFFINSADSLELFQMELGIPANAALVEHILPLLEAPALITVEFGESLMEITGAGVSAPVGAQEIDALFVNVAERVMFGELSSADAAAEFMSQATTILEANR